METLFRSIQTLQRRLNKAGIPSVVIGGVAVATWGNPRVTRDVDLKVLLGREDADRLLALLSRDYALLLLQQSPMRKTLTCSRAFEMRRAAAAWEDVFYDLVRPLEALRLGIADDPQRRGLSGTPARAAGLADPVWSVKELLTVTPAPSATLKRKTTERTTRGNKHRPSPGPSPRGPSPSNRLPEQPTETLCRVRPGRTARPLFQAQPHLTLRPTPF